MISKDVGFAEQLLKKGELVGIPTETVYGLGANALNEKAVAQIFAVKQRPAFDPLIIHLASSAELDKYVTDIPTSFEQLYQAFCPGPITFILKKREIIPDIVTAGLSTVGVRFPSLNTTQQLLRLCNFPIAAPSANLFGSVSPTSAKHVDDQLGKNIGLVLDGGQTTIGLESTIIDLTTKEPIILRLGGLALEAIESVLETKVKFKTHSSSNPKAPGMLSSHYSPGIPVIFDFGKQDTIQFPQEALGAISFRKKIAGVNAEHQRILSEAGDLNEAAAKLFSALRSFDPQKTVAILAEKFPEEGLGRAINDRLKRAAHR